MSEQQIHRGFVDFRTELSVSPRQHQRIDREVAFFVVHFHFEPVFQQAAQHDSHLRNRGVRIRGSGNVESFRDDPIRRVHQFTRLNLIRKLDERLQGHIRYGDTPRCDSPIFTGGKIEANTTAKRYRSGSVLPLVLTIGPCGFGFQIGNLPAHLHNLPLQSFLGHKERTEQVPTQIEKVRNRLE